MWTWDLLLTVGTAYPQIPGSGSEGEQQREAHHPALQHVLRLTEAGAERLDLLQNGVGVERVEQRELALHLFALEAERPLGAQIELIPPRFEFAVRRNQIEARRLRLGPGGEQDRRGYDGASALAVREGRGRYRPIDPERRILRGVAVALAGEADEHAADFDTPLER